jgi:hypothetical protein
MLMRNSENVFTIQYVYACVLIVLHPSFLS